MGGDNKVWLLEKEKCDNTGNSTLANIYIIYNLQKVSPPTPCMIFDEYSERNTM